jgi:hypothetical protein
MSIRNALRKTGNLLLAFASLAAAANIGIAVMRVDRDAEKKDAFSKSPVVSTKGYTGETKAGILGKELPFSNGPLIDAALAGLALTTLVGKKKSQGK